MKLTKDYLASLTKEEKEKIIVREYIKCRENIQYCIETYFTILVGKTRIPFKLFSYQNDVIDAYEKYTTNLAIKTRQTGFTTLTASYLAHKIIFNNNYKVVIISKTLKDSKDFLKMIKDTLNDARKEYPWLIPDYKNPGGNLNESITLTTGSLIKAEAATEDAGRGTPGLCSVVVDESFCEDTKLMIKNKKTCLIEEINVKKLYEILFADFKFGIESGIMNKFQINKFQELATKVESKDLTDTLCLDIDNINSQDSTEILLNDEFEILTPNGWKNFSAIKKISIKEYYTIILDNDSELSCSKYHRVKTKENVFVYVKDLVYGMELQTKDGFYKIIDIKKYDKEIEMYDLLDVGEEQEYYTNEILSHNCAFIDRKSPEKMSEIWSAVSPALASVKGKAILISTPKGSSGWYYSSYCNAKTLGINILDVHWTRHPIYNKGTYQWIFEDEEKTKGYLKFHNETWPDSIFDKDAASYIEVSKDTYQFICDGKIRSPWYDNEAKKLGERLSRCELDCEFIGTGGEVFEPEILREMKRFSESCTFTNPFEHLKGIYKNYREYKAPIEGHKYLISADVATGDGSDFSAFTVIDMTDLEIVATYKEQLLSITFANIIARIGKRYFNCHAVVENAGGGETTLQELKRKNYPHIYYSTLNKKDPSTGVRKRKIGLWASESVRWQGGDRLEEVIRMKHLLIPCEYLVSEFYTWIWDKDGKRRHAPEKNDDIIMALQHGMWYFHYVYQRSQKNRKVFKKNMEIRRNGESVKISDNLYGRGTIIQDQTQYTIMPQSSVSISGNIDKMIDSRIMSQNELAQRKDRIKIATDNGRGNNKRTYI